MQLLISFLSMLYFAKYLLFIHSVSMVDIFHSRGCDMAPDLSEMLLMVLLLLRVECT